jgi:hypothetical protein
MREQWVILAAQDLAGRDASRCFRERRSEERILSVHAGDGQP